MKKNQTLRTAALISTGAALTVACNDTQDIPVNPNQPTTNADGKYNIIFITTDQEAYMEQYPAGSDYAARERLRQIGTTFEKHYACANVSTSSRSVIYTGRHITETCMLDNTNYAFVNDMPRDLPTVGDMLREAGYYTAFKGKWHISGDTESLEEYGFSDWTEGDMYGSVWEGYKEDGTIADHAIDWLKTKGKQLNSDGQSFFLAVNFLNPHDIMYFNETPGTYIAGEATPAPDDPIYKKTYATPVPASWNEPFDKPGRPAAHKEYNKQWQAWVGPSPTTEEGWHTFRDYYFNTIQNEDNHMLAFLNYLEEAGLMKNTIVIYTSDHGEMQGEHGLKGKGGNMYENNIHVPLIIYHPEIQGGSHCKNLTSHLDLAPTFVDIATAGNQQQFNTITSALHGHSLLPAVKNPATDIRNSEGALFCFEMISMIDGDYVMDPNLKPAYRADMNKRGFVRGIITPEYKFARYFSPLNFNTPAEYETLWANNDVELLQCGTDETENLAWPKNNANKSLVETMNQKLNALIQREIGTDDGSETKKGYLGGVETYDKNKYDGVEVTACDELQMFQNYIVTTDDEGNFVERVYGKVLNEADTTIVSIGADNVEEARKIFERWLAFEPNVQETAPNVLTYYPKDEDGEPQGEIYFTPVSDDPTCTARVTYSAETPLRHFKQIEFIPRSLWPENDQTVKTKWEKWKRDGITWTCVRPSSEGVPQLSVYIDRWSKERENTPEWIWDHWDETGATYACDGPAKAVSEIAMEDWDAFVEHCMPEGKYGEEAYINKKKTGFADGIYVIQLKKAKFKLYTFWEFGVWSYTHHNYIKCSYK